MSVPITQYTKSGNINIAYQVFGSGKIDLVYVPGWVSNIDLMWACSELVHFFQELGKLVRIILFDKRGTGLSDRVVEKSTLEERMEDITAVMNAVDSERAILFGHSEGGSVSALYSATYPNKVISLITFGIFAKRRFSENYPWAPKDHERQKLYDMIENNWCGGEMYLETLAPSKANDPNFMKWLASYFRSGASPQAALKLTKMNTNVNIMGILKYIQVPTLLMQRTNDIDVKIEEGRYIAQHIKGVKFVEFNGSDHLFWAGNTAEVLKEMKTFIKDLKPKQLSKKGLFSVLFGEITTTSLHFNFEMIKILVDTYGGEVIKKQKTSFRVLFKVPGKAVNCSIAIREALKIKNIDAAFGVCMKEVEENSTIIFTQEIEHKIQMMRSKIRPNEILITPTIKHLLSGASLNFSSQTTIFDTETLRSCKLYKVSKKIKSLDLNDQVKPTTSSNHNPFLEKILLLIDEHVEDSVFTIDDLSKKMGLSERQLQRRVKENTGKSPSKLITSIRLKQARVALMTDMYSVSEIAFRYGFSCPSYFSKCFKKEFGNNPTELLQKNTFLK